MVQEAEARIGLTDLPLKSEYPNGMLPVRCHIPKYGEWFEGDGFSCHLLPHVVLELEARCRKTCDVSVTVLKNGSYAINIGKTK